MKKSIWLKLFAGITLLIVFFVLCSWLLNTKYLGDYYRAQKKQFLISAATRINSLYDGNPENISFDLESLERNSGLTILIMDDSYEVKYSTQERRDRFQPKRPEPRLGMLLGRNAELQENGVIIQITGDPHLKTNFINLIYLLQNKDLLVLSSPLAAIEDNAAAANQFFLYTGIFTIFLGSMLAFILARKFTQPILELNKLAQEITRLDFSRKYNVTSDDEIGELGKSINSLSEQLHSTISELQDANNKLKEDIEQERKIDEMRKEFISSVSHELKTPIALIQGYAEGLKVNVIEDEENKNFYCGVIIDEASKMNKLVKDLLELSQIESGYFNLDKTVFNIASLVDRLIVKYEPIFAEKDIKPQLNLNPSLKVNADFIRSEQVLLNYLNNALNHIDEQKILKIGMEETGEKVRISIFNSGAAIPEQSLDRVFTSFYKVDKARTRAYGGSGMGLSVVRAIQEQDHNGYGVANLDGGVEFWFELDRA